ncbi:hypothetical protein [Phaffia rhodozyma]|uniref:Uncharacterized protein n=1 Tax=Phaffia rhodozyma TaxID=264483 RepID=A0A0F7SKK9_PHARH|nr:hypothetical protein [Phaffia rhodozyma]
MVMERKVRSEHGEQAYQIQKDAGIRSMITWTIGATVATILAHNTWPFFRKQTLPFKAFLISSATMSGLVIGAEGNLQEFEKNQKKTYNMERRWAKVELAKEGRIATEYEIARWIADHPPSSYPSWSSLGEGKPFAYNSPSTDPTSSTSTPASASVLASAPTGSVSSVPVSDASSPSADSSSQAEHPTMVVRIEGVEDPLELSADK